MTCLRTHYKKSEYSPLPITISLKCQRKKEWERVSNFAWYARIISIMSVAHNSILQPLSCERARLLFSVWFSPRYSVFFIKRHHQFFSPLRSPRSLSIRFFVFKYFYYISLILIITLFSFSSMLFFSVFLNCFNNIRNTIACLDSPALAHSSLVAFLRMQTLLII